jgi:peptide/nickel transport system ATP-binding protein
LQADKPAIEIRSLTVAYQGRYGAVEAVRDIDLQIHAGQVYGLVGESGSGKTTLALAMLGYLPEQARIQHGGVELNGRRLSELSAGELRQLWGRQIALVPQDPLAALNPSMTIGKQVAEASFGMTPAEARKKTLSLLRMVRIADAEQVIDRYPHQISGGMQQRILIAMALCLEPQVLLLDEPTTGLDATTEAVVLDLIRELVHSRQTATLYVSHSLGVVAQFADRVAVLYASELVEDAPKIDLFAQPLHPYTQGLLDSVPRLGESKREIQLRAIAGQIPRLGELPEACVFAPRCPLAIEICWEQRPELELVDSRRGVRCHRWQEIQSGEVDPRHETSAAVPPPIVKRPRVLSISGLEVRYPLSRTLQESLTAKPVRAIRAVDGLDMELDEGETLGLVGESGSGKTSLAKAVIGLVEPSAGEIELLGVELPPSVSARSWSTLRQVQMVFQNPDEALNPYLSVGESLTRPLVSFLGRSRPQALQQAARLLEAVRLPAEYASRYPSQLSGGEKQRVAIARAFAAIPELVLCDEPVSSLDVSVQASILNLLTELQLKHSTSMLFISHDIAVVGFLADRVGVLYLGKLMEIARSEALFRPPYHPYTEALLSAIPLLDPQASQRKVRLEGELPSASEPPAGCPFHTRCPRYIGPICEEQIPPWQVDQSGKRIFCHIPIDELKAGQEVAFIMKKREI